MRNQPTKTFVLIAIFLFAATLIFAQGGVSINHIGAEPDQSAVLDLSNATKGFLPPKMSTTVRDAISSPATGLIVYNTTTNCLEFYTGTSWVSIKCACDVTPNTPSSITGSTTVCPGANAVAYSVTPEAGVTYTWSYSGTGFTCASGCTSSSITADFSGSATSGTLSVTPSNGCGNGTAQTLTSACIYTLQPGPEGKDAFWGTNTPHVNGWCCRDDLSFGGWGDWYYDYIEFDLTGSPAAAQTVTAELWLYANSPPNDPGLKMNRITSAWNETAGGGPPGSGVTSSSNPSSVFYTNMPNVGGSNSGWKVTDITSLYKDWKNATYPNYGVKIEPTGNNQTNGSFNSSDYTTDPSLRPKLVVYY